MGGFKSGDLGGHKDFEIIRSSKKLSISVMLSFEVVACGSILLKIAGSELVIIKLIHKFVEDLKIARSI